jgi:DNA-binding NarL/FixJ family response regulator
MSVEEYDNPITVYVVHPDDDTRTEISTRLRADESLEVVDERADADIDDVLTLMPDVLVVATGHDDFDGPMLISNTHREAPVITVVALLVDPAAGYPALAAGALSTLAAADPEPETVVKEARRGESRINQQEARAMLTEFDRATAPFEAAEHRPMLTTTEREVLERLAQGEELAHIAEEYEVSDRLVSVHAGYAVGKVHWALDAERELARTGGAGPAPG